MTPEERVRYGGLVGHKSGEIVHDFINCTFGTIIYNTRTKQVGVHTSKGILTINITSCGYHIRSLPLSVDEARKDRWISFGVNLGGVLKRIEDVYNAK